MKVPIAVASKHGATTDIANEIARVLHSRAIDADTQACEKAEC